MAQWKPLSVKNAITKIKDEEMVLPVIQRRLVWEEDKMELLFDSLLKGNSFGSIICIEEERDSKPLFAYRKFTQDGTPIASHEVSELAKTQWFVIDGQQRLQSLYIGLTGTMKGKRLYFDLFSDSENMEYEFKFAVNDEKLPKFYKDRTIEECCWYPVDDLFERLSSNSKSRQVAEGIVKKLSIQDSNKKNAVDDNIRDFSDAVFADGVIGFSIVSVNKSEEAIVDSRQRIVELFRRLNDGGTKLSPYDLVASMFKGFDYEMEDFLDEAASKYKDIGLDQDALIKLLLVLNDKPTKGILDLTPEDAKFVSSNKDRIKATLEAVKIFLTLSKNIVWFRNTNRSTIPLYFLAYHIFYSKTETKKLKNKFDQYDTTDSDYIAMARWLRMSLLNKLFSYGCGWKPNTTGIKRIHNVLATKKGEKFPTDEIFKNAYSNYILTFRGDITDKTIQSFDLNYVLYLIYNGQGQVRSEDIDHIHPKSLLEQSGVAYEKINNVVNYQLLDGKTNRGKKNGKELAVWITNFIEEVNKDTYLDRHIIPNNEDLWKTENFDQFFEERAKMLADRINKWL